MSSKSVAAASFRPVLVDIGSEVRVRRVDGRPKQTSVTFRLFLGDSLAFGCLSR